jgi:hypothetical protein
VVLDHFYRSINVANCIFFQFFYVKHATLDLSVVKSHNFYAAQAQSEIYMRTRCCAFI